MDILRERLARGEITPQQYDEAAARLGTQSAAAVAVAAAPAAAIPVAVPPRKKSRFWLWFWIIAVILVLGGVVYYDLAGGLSTRSITGIQGQSMSFVLTNAADRSGDVVFWANIDGLEVCHGIVSIGGNSQTAITAPCPQMIAGPFTLQTFWADAYPEEARKATRIIPR
jgi:hypothetical protein